MRVGDLVRYWDHNFPWVGLILSIDQVHGTPNGSEWVEVRWITDADGCSFYLSADLEVISEGR